MNGLKSMFLVAIATLLAACGMQSNSNNSASHANMNHNALSTQPVNNSKMDHGQMDHSTMKSSPNAAAADYDLQFIDTMIAHHQAAVDMAKLIAGKTERPELKKMGAKMTASQQKEIDDMKAWREKWFAGKPAAINMEMAGMASSMSGMDMKKLGGATGNSFDLEFIRQMLPHHEGAVVMAQEALKKSEKDEIKSLANDIIREQNAEIEMMKAWQKEWSK